MGHVFTANRITEELKKWAIFLSVIDAGNYKLLSSLMAPDNPSDKEYSDLVVKLSEHFAPAPSEIVERFKFHTRFRKQLPHMCLNYVLLWSVAILEALLRPCWETALFVESTMEWFSIECSPVHSPVHGPESSVCTNP